MTSSMMKRQWPILLAALLAASHAGTASAADGNVYTIANYPVDARAQDAVAAKEKAIADGQQAAFRSLIKRLTPVTAYKALATIKTTPAANLIEGIAVRKERNSSTSYTATLDFSFDARRIKELLQRRGISVVDEQAPQTAVVLVFLPPVAAATAGITAAQGKQMWRDAWTSLDLANALAPMKLHEPPAALTLDIIKASMTNPDAPLHAIATLSKTGQAMLAVAEPDATGKRFHVTLSGTDAVGSFVLRRTWRLDPQDAAYSAELAAVVSHGILEGRWKAGRARGAAPLPASGAVLQPVQLYVEFRSMQDWQSMRRQIAEMPGVSDFLVGGMSARSAEVALRYPGGGEPLSSALATQGIELRGASGTWIARSAN